MSRMKEYFFLLCQERDKALGKLPDALIETWPELFQGYGRLKPPSEVFDERFPHCSLYALFKMQLQEILQVAYFNKTHQFKRVVYGMAYSHAVTLLESFISQSLIALALKYDVLLPGLAVHYDRKKKEKMSLKDVISLPDGIRGRLKQCLTEDVFHNPDTIRSIFEDMFGEEGKGVAIGSLKPIISRRHDIVHRNGSATNGDVLHVGLDVLEADNKLINEFALDLKDRMTNAIVKFY